MYPIYNKGIILPSEAFSLFDISVVPLKLGWRLPQAETPHSDICLKTGPFSVKFTVSPFCGRCRRIVLQLPSSHFTNGHLPAKRQIYHTFLS